MICVNDNENFNTCLDNTEFGVTTMVEDSHRFHFEKELSKGQLLEEFVTLLEGILTNKNSPENESGTWNVLIPDDLDFSLHCFSRNDGGVLSFTFKWKIHPGNNHIHTGTQDTEFSRIDELLNAIDSVRSESSGEDRRVLLNRMESVVRNELSDKSLENEKTLSVFTFLLWKPGCYTKEIVEETEIRNSSMYHHLSKLEQAGLITSEKKGNRRYYFTVFRKPSRSMRTRTQEKTLAYIKEKPGISTREISDRVGVKIQTIVSRIKTMRHQGIIEGRRCGKRLGWYLVEHKNEPEVNITPAELEYGLKHFSELEKGELSNSSGGTRSDAIIWIIRENQLHHQNTMKIFELIRSHPGIHFRGISKSINIGSGTLSHHLSKLHRTGLIKSVRAMHFHHYYVHDTITENRSVSPQLKETIEIVKQYPGITVKTTAKMLDISIDVALYRLRKLVKFELARRDRTGNTYHYYLADEPETMSFTSYPMS